MNSRRRLPDTLSVREGRPNRWPNHISHKDKNSHNFN